MKIILQFAGGIKEGAGMLYDSSLPIESFTTEQMILDTVEVTNYLRDRFGTDKIYLMGHSWGSFLGVNTVAQYPELYEAYIGIGQVTNQLESEKLGYQYMIDKAKQENDQKNIEKLSKYSISDSDDITTEYLMLRSDIMGKYGNEVFHVAKSKFKDILLPIFQAKEYTLKDKYGYAMGAEFALKCPFNKEQMDSNLIEEITSLEIPVYIMHGIYDMQVFYDLSKKYYELLEAPKKEFYTFENSAHSPFMEEPEKFIQIIKEDILFK